jgi:TRAP-type uncharacterized transport system substrate-binding protein
MRSETGLSCANAVVLSASKAQEAANNFFIGVSLFFSLDEVSKAICTWQEGDMKTRTLFLLLLLGLGLVFTAGFYGVRYAMRPTVLKIAVPKIAMNDLKIFTAFSAYLKKETRKVHLELVQTNTPQEATNAFEKGQVQLITSRSDYNLPHNGNLVAILRREQIILIAPKKSNVKETKDLKGKTIGVIRNFEPNLNFAKEYIEANSLANVKLIGLNHEEVTASVKANKADVYMLFGAPSNPTTQQVLKDIAKESKAEPTLLPVLMASTVSGQSAKFYSSEIPANSYGSNPSRPDDEVTTTSIAIVLLAQSKIDNEVIAELSERLFAARRALVDENANFRLIETPDTDIDQPIKIHAGTVAQIEGERQSFIERYSEYFYTGSIGLSALISAFAALWGLKTRQDRLATAHKLKAARILVQRAHIAQTQEQAQSVMKDAALLIDKALKHAEEGDLDQADAAALQLAMGEIHAALKRFSVLALPISQQA